MDAAGSPKYYVPNYTASHPKWQILKVTVVRSSNLTKNNSISNAAIQCATVQMLPQLYFWFHVNRQGSSSVLFCTSSCKLRHLISSPAFVCFALPLIFWNDAYRHLNHKQQPFRLPVYARHTYWSVLVWLRHQSLAVHSSVIPLPLTSLCVCACQLMHLL